MKVQIFEKKYRLYLSRTTPGTVTVDGTQRLRNKTIDAAENTIIGLEPEIPKSLGAAVWTAEGWAFDNTAYIPASAVGSAVQAYDADLAAIAALPGTTGLVRKTGAGAFALDNSAYLVSGGALGTPTSGNLSSCTADGANPVGTGNIPQNSRSTNYTCVSTDANKHIFHPSADVTARTFTIPANTSVAYPVGTTLTFVNQNAAGAITISINTDTMRKHGEGTTGSRTLPANRIAVALKVTATEWLISGAD